MSYLTNIYYIYANMDKNSKFLLMMIGLIILLLILVVIISAITKQKEMKNYKQNQALREEYKNNFKNSNKCIKYDEDISNIDLTPSIKIGKKLKSTEAVAPIVKENNDILENKFLEVVNENEENEKIEELNDDVDVEIIEVMKEEPDDEIENIKKMIENTLEQEPIRLNDFEQEQEECAIISYDELIKKAGTKKIVYKTADEPKIVKPIVEENVDKKAFKPSRVVSPIYGVQTETKDKDEVLESFEEIDKIKASISQVEDNEMKKDRDFLTNLKNFRKGLD